MNIFDLKYKKGEYFENKYIKISNDNIYLSDEFINNVLSLDIISTLNMMKSLSLNYHNTNINMTINHNGFNFCKLTIYLFYIGKYKTSKHEWLVCGSSGDYGFNGLERTKKELLGVNTKRKVIRFFVNLYLNSKLARKEKIESFLEK